MSNLDDFESRLALVESAFEADDYWSRAFDGADIAAAR